MIEQAVVESRAVLEADLLKRALGLTPTGFEDLVLALIGAMGYGKTGSVSGPVRVVMRALTGSSARIR